MVYVPGQVEMESSWVRGALSSGLQRVDGISGEGDTRGGVVWANSEQGLGFSTCLYTCSESHDWQGGWKAVGVSPKGVSLRT